MKKKTLIFILTALFAVGHHAMAAPSDYESFRDDFSTDTFCADNWTLTEENELLTCNIAQDTENDENSCLKMWISPGSKTEFYNSRAIVKEPQEKYYTASFRMKLNTGTTYKTEYAGCYIYYNGENDFLALEWSRRLNTTGYERVALVKNGYDTGYAVSEIKASAAVCEGWDFMKWTDYKIVYANGDVSVYINNSETPCITYSENNPIQVLPRFGFFNRSKYAVDSALYADDLTISSEAKALRTATAVCKERYVDVLNTTETTDRIIDEIRLEFGVNVTESDICLYDSEKNAVSCAVLSQSENAVSLRPLKKLAANEKYYITINSLVTADGDTLRAVPRIAFKTTADSATLTALQEDGKIKITAEIDNAFSDAYIYSILYKDGVALEIKGFHALSGHNETEAGFEAPLENGMKISVFAFSGQSFDGLMASPVSLTIE